MLKKAVKESPINANGDTEYTGPYRSRQSQTGKTKNRKKANVVPPPITVRPLYISRRSTSTIRPSSSFIDWFEHDAGKSISQFRFTAGVLIISNIQIRAVVASMFP